MSMTGYGAFVVLIPGYICIVMSVGKFHYRSYRYTDEGGRRPKLLILLAIGGAS